MKITEKENAEGTEKKTGREQIKNEGTKREKGNKVERHKHTMQVGPNVQAAPILLGHRRTALQSVQSLTHI